MKQAIAAIALAAAIAAPALAHEAEAPPAPAAFALPEPGSYELPPIAHVAELELLDEAGAKAPLLGLAPDQVAVVSFVYSRCGDGATAARPRSPCCSGSTAPSRRIPRSRRAFDSRR